MLTSHRWTSKRRELFVNSKLCPDQYAINLHRKSITKFSSYCEPLFCFFEIPVLYCDSAIFLRLEKKFVNNEIMNEWLTCCHLSSRSIKYQTIFFRISSSFLTFFLPIFRIRFAEKILIQCWSWVTSFDTHNRKIWYRDQTECCLAKKKHVHDASLPSLCKTRSQNI